MKLNKKYAVLMFSIFTTLSLTANASGNLSAEQIYSYAKNKNLAALKDIKNNIDIPNKSGNTALLPLFPTRRSSDYQERH